MRVLLHLLVRAQVEQPAGGVVGACGAAQRGQSRRRCDRGSGDAQVDTLRWPIERVREQQSGGRGGNGRAGVPVENASPLGKKWTALISDSWPVNVCVGHASLLMSQILAAASHAPETKMFFFGAIEMLITSPLCPFIPPYCFFCWPVSTSHSMQLMSPDEVRIVASSRKRQQER